jgi:hypothetical protein
VPAAVTPPSRPTLHKGALLMKSAFQGSGTLVELVSLEPKSVRTCVNFVQRGVIGNTPSAGTHRRFGRALAGIAWGSLQQENLYVGNVTYHGIPRDGRAVARDKKVFLRRLDRAFGPRGRCWGMVWVKEFQRRGSWHLHFLLYLPFGCVGASAYEVMRDNWLAVIGEEEDMAAWLHGVECSKVKSLAAVKAYESKYMNKKSRSGAKAYEKVQPKWFTGGGRWWGIVGKVVLPRLYESIMLTTRYQFVTVKRLLRSYVRHLTHGRYTPRVYSWEHGMTILAHGADNAFTHAVIGWLQLAMTDRYPLALGRE